MINNLTQYVPSEVCLACDGCCRFKEEDSRWRPVVAPEEMTSAVQEGLARYILTKEALDQKNRIKTTRCHDGTYQCRFFSPDGNICTIYAYRPFECRLYPFVLMRQRQGIVLTVHLSCPHIQNTRNLMEFDRYVLYLKKFFQMAKVRRFIRKNAALIDDYADYQDELEMLFLIEM